MRSSITDGGCGLEVLESDRVEAAMGIKLDLRPDWFRGATTRWKTER